MGLEMAGYPLLIGLTGSIGMGKSTAARFLAREGWRVFDADQAVHRLMAPGGQAVAPLAALFPAALTRNDQGLGFINRAVLRAHIAENPEDIPQLERILHPLVRQDQQRARALASKGRCKGLVLDIPLLFETNGDQRCDIVMVVTAPAQVQRSRVLRRTGMTDQAFRTLMAKQMPDREKRRRADLVINTGLGHRRARQQVRRGLAELTQASQRGHRRRSTFHPPLFGPENPRRWTPKRQARQYGGCR